jgi:hypothetical protein
LRPISRSGSTVIVSELHLLLAFASVMIALFVSLDAFERALRRIPPTRTNRRLELALMLAVLASVAAGLWLLVGGARPRDGLHFVWVVIAFGAIPVAGSLGRRWDPDPRPRAIATLVGGVVSIAAILRLYGTG